MTQGTIFFVLIMYIIILALINGQISEQRKKPMQDHSTIEMVYMIAYVGMIVVAVIAGALLVLWSLSVYISYILSFV